MKNEHFVSAIDELSQAAIFRRVGDICATVNTVVDAGELLDVSLKKIMELFGANRGSIFITDGNSGEMTLAASSGLERREQKQMVKRMGQGIVGQVARDKKPIIVEDIANDERFENFKARSRYTSSSFICAPLMVKDGLIGVINITDKISGHRFREEEMQLLDFLATQIALNYRRIQLYKKFKKIVKEKKTLKDRLGKSGREAEHLKQQVFIQEKLATIGKLAGGIAHEFNNPLDGVMRYTNLCLEKAGHDEVLRGYLMEIKQGLNRMAKIVKNLLACSRNDIRANERIDFRQGLERSLSMLSSEISAKNIAVEKSVQKDVPALIDLGLERILSNLLRNAVDAIEKDGKIAVEVSYDQDDFVLSIADTGKGIAEDAIDKIFEPFYTTKDIGKGCGLGLTIVGEVVKAYEGRVEVESELNKGTVFTLTFPVERII